MALPESEMARRPGIQLFSEIFQRIHHSVVSPASYSILIMLLDRVRDGTSQLWSGRDRYRIWLVILLVLLIVYLFMGTASFWALERNYHERSIQKWRGNVAATRRNFAKSISSRIFNDTRNLLIIIDREQTERVQQLLVESLARYEEKVDMKVPDLKEWNFLNSFNYAYGLLLTLGHGTKIPETTAGKIFALIYCVLGIPLFYATIAMCGFVILKPFLQSTARKHRQRLLVLYLVIAMYVVWSLCITFSLYYWVNNQFWHCLFTAFLSGMTVQIPLYDVMSPCWLAGLLGACTVSIAILVMAAIILASVYSPCNAAPQKDALLQGAAPEPQKFTIIVDEAGDSKLAEQNN